MKHTLNEYLKFYTDVTIVNLIIADHTIRINCEEDGSWFIIRKFKNEKFYFKKMVDGYELTLSINE